MFAEVINQGWWAEYVSLLHDPAHLLLELTIMLVFDGLLLGLAIPFIKRAVRKHDRENHSEQTYK